MSLKPVGSSPTYVPKKSEQLNVVGYYANGITAICSMIITCQPGFVWKTYASKGIKFPPVRILQKREWFRFKEAFKISYRGWFNHAVGGFLIQGLAFVANGVISDHLSDRGKRPLTPLEKLVSSAGAAFFASPVNTVFELAYCRTHITGKHVVHVTKEIVKEGGVLGLMRGWRATTLRAMVYISSLFGINDGCQALTNKLLPKNFPLKKRVADISGSALSGGLAGAGTGFIDMIKTCMQVDYKGEKYTGVIQTGRLILKEQGWKQVIQVTKIRSILIAGVVTVVATSKDAMPYLFPRFLFKHEYRS